MPNVDQFESAFKAADKPVFEYRRVEVEKVLVVSDLPSDGARALSDRVRAAMTAVDGRAVWEIAEAEDSRTIEQLLALVERERPSLICTYRSLHSGAWRWPHTLGRHLDVLTQATPAPVLVIPHPAEAHDKGIGVPPMHEVMAMTDHLAGDNRLVNWAVRLTPADGKLLLSHIENERTFEHYLEVISKIPEIDTDLARQRIGEQLLKEPADYIRSCQKVLREQGVEVRVEPIVQMGDQLEDYRRLIAEQGVDLLVMNTKDDRQMAMAGVAYELAVELRTTPLLLL